MFHHVIYVFCIFVTVWQGIIFIGNALNGSLESFGNLNILLMAAGITGIILRANGLW